jgi:SAM-dependent methyltransferase
MSGEIFLWEKNEARYVRCKQCKLVYENPRLTESELKDFYSEESYFVRSDSSIPVVGYEDYCAQCTPKLQREYFGIVERYTARKSGRYLDIGCGTGGVVKAAQQKGWEAVGQEISSWAVEQGHREGTPIVHAGLLEAHFPENHFDAVSMFDVLEHLPSPVSYVREIYRILNHGGVLVVETPNIDGFFARHFYKEKSDLVKPRAHICLYGPTSSHRLFSEAPFSKKLIRTFPYCRRYTVAYLKGVIATRILPHRVPVQLTFNESLRIICWK